MFTKFIAGTILGTALMLSSVLIAGKQTGDCCALQLSCCQPGAACCEKADKPLCCQEGRACCTAGAACCAK